MKNKVIAAIVIVAMLCGISYLVFSNNSKNNGSHSENSNSSSNSNDNSATTDENSDNVTSTDSKTLVVYYSATGTTEGIAKIIAREANADIFVIEPVNAYSLEDLDWTDSSSRVSVEYNDSSKRNIELKSTTVENWNSYDTVYIGYPIWWGIAAWPMNNFVSSNDFTGKTVIPFCTASSSEIGQSAKNLENMTNTGTWKDGIRFTSSYKESDVIKWVESQN